MVKYFALFHFCRWQLLLYRATSVCSQYICFLCKLFSMLTLMRRFTKELPFSRGCLWKMVKTDMICDD